MIKVLVLINHFFGSSPGFNGGSTNLQDDDKQEQRLNYLQKCRTSLERIPAEVDLRVCGIAGHSLVPLDLEFNHISNRPTHLIYESLNKMTKFIDDYDYFINIEDDIIFPPETFNNILEFDNLSDNEAVFLPNRLEVDKTGRPFCIDLYCIPGWQNETMNFLGRKLRVARNPHSALLVLSRKKLAITIEKINSEFRGVIVGREMASAYAYFHTPFKLFRSFSDPTFHVVHHQDRFKGSPNIIDEKHPHHPYGFKSNWEKNVKLVLPDFIYRRLKYRKWLPRR